ncbi:MAG: Rieske Fe-S protein [bacterium]|nr:Rieske Fe-S protein [bacterium]
MSEISRRSFLEAAAAAGCGALLLGGCQTGSSVDGTVTPTQGMAQLTFAMFPKLMTVGDGVIADLGSGPIAVIRTSDTAAMALSAVCTHAGCTVEIQSGSPPLYCPCHGSEFALSGVAVRGPARTALRTYPATVDMVGVTVMVG